MNVFAVISLGPNAAIKARVAEQFPSDHLELTPSNWLVAGRGTAEEVSAKLGLNAGDTNSTIVLAMSDYYGRAPVNIWSWIEAKLEAPAHG